jgi:hypothetical protein
MKISGLVAEWGGLEKLVAKLHETGKVSVEQNAILKGRSGAPRQVAMVGMSMLGEAECVIVRVVGPEDG